MSRRVGAPSIVIVRDSQPNLTSAMPFSGVVSHRADQIPDIATRLREGLLRYSTRPAAGMCPSRFAWMGDAGTAKGANADARQRHALYVAVDGRIDNSDELKRSLDLDDDVSDSCLIATCYRRWGTDGFSRLIGDWATAIYDASSDEVLLSRDYPGTRTLYYYLDHDRLVWSTDLLDIINALGTVRVDADYLVDYLIVRYTSQLTPYKNVWQFPGGSGVCIRDFKARRFGGIDLHTRTRQLPTGAADLSAEFGSLLRQAVDDRLRAPIRYGAELSGGMDSSSVVCVADRTWQSTGRDPDGLVTITMVSDDSSSKIDEKYAALVNERTCFRNVRLDEDEAGMLFPRSGAIPPLVLPDQAVGRQAALARLCRREGIGMIVTGEGGDLVGFSGYSPYAAVLSDLWSQRRLATLYRKLLAWSAQQHRPIWHCWWHDCVRLRNAITARRGCVMWDLQRYVPWVRASDAFLRSTTPLESDTDQLSTGAILFQEALQSIQYLLSDSRHILRPVRTTHPFLDRRLIEFAYSVPPSAAREPGRSRIIQREALRDVLPEDIVRRRSKRAFDDLVYRHLCQNWSRVEALIDGDSRLAVCGVVDRDVLQRSANAVRNGDGNLQGGFHRLLSLELWLRNLPSQVSI